VAFFIGRTEPKQEQRQGQRQRARAPALREFLSGTFHVGVILILIAHGDSEGKPAADFDPRSVK
jgi:hypothetical protein